MLRHLAAAGLLVAAMMLADRPVQAADVFNMGGTRNPTTGTWTGLASLDMVPVGDPQRPDPMTYGVVTYTYNIGKYDVTAAQYTVFLNAVAKTDTYGLYNTNMQRTTSGGPGIAQSGSPGSYTYTVDAGRANKPVTYVCFWDACRFTNWLANGQPTGDEASGTTETGSYTLTAAGESANTIMHNTGATWRVTSEAEWFKAAYYDPGLNHGAGGYWHTATQGDSQVTSLEANFGNLIGDTTDVGAYLYPSHYGTFDQAGEVWEWNEDTEWFNQDRRIRGGSYDSNILYLDAPDGLSMTYPTYEGHNLGFRVSDVPEPATLSLLALGGFAMLRRRR